MTTAELIKELQTIDPDGTSHVRFSDGILTGIIRYENCEYGPVMYVDGDNFYIDTKTPIVDILCDSDIDSFISQTMGEFPNIRSIDYVRSKLNFITDPDDEYGSDLINHYKKRLVNIYHQLYDKKRYIYVTTLKSLLSNGVYENDGNLYNAKMDTLLREQHINVLRTSRLWPEFSEISSFVPTNYTIESFIGMYNDYVRYTSTLAEPDYNYLIEDINEPLLLRIFELEEFVEMFIKNDIIFNHFKKD